MKNRNLILIIGTISMIIFGLMYNWTVFSKPVSESLNTSVASTTLVFSFCQISFCIGGVLSGFLFKKLPYQPSMIIGACLVGTGLFLTSMATNINSIYLTYSLIFNFSSGFCYKNLLTTVIRWFKDKAGFATGVLLMGCGLSAFVSNMPMTFLIEMIGWRSAMKVLALIAFAVSLLSALYITPCKEDKNATTKSVVNEFDEQVTTKKMIKDPRFYFFFMWTVLILAGATTLSGNSVILAVGFGMTASFGAMLSMTVSLTNSMSRIAYGIIYDRKGRKLAMSICTAMFLLSIICLNIFIFTKISYLLVLAMVFIGLCFGGIPSIASTYVLKTFGNENYPSNFSIQGLYSLFASQLGTTLFGVIYSNTQSYEKALSILLLYAIITLLLYFIINKVIANKNKQRDMKMIEKCAS
ncbi:MFS transporter [Anaerorhabdus sp.]|uniref:MFS transporter n=1 Tax=Anaerorhabdus sp. TaxID=1872524 RepID=UPI002FCBCC05